MNKLTTIIFDFDGVTVNTEDTFAGFDCKLINTYLEKANLPPTLKPSDVRQLAGMPGADKLIKIGMLLDKDMTPYIEDYTAERNEKRKTLFADCKIPLCKNIEVLLKKLGKQHSALATNKIKEKLNRDLEYMGHKDIYDIIITCDPPMRRKPEPDIILEAMKRLKAIPEECAYIGDNPSDMIAAKAAKVTPIGFVTKELNNKHKRAQLLKDAGAMLIIDDFEDLIPYIK